MLNFERMRALHAVAAHGSIHAAASVLHVTDSAVSQQIARLERDLGRALLERQGRGVKLTAAAEQLVKRAEQMLQVMAQAEAEVDAQSDAVTGEIAVAAFPSAMRSLVPAALGVLRRAQPRLRVTLMEQPQYEALPLLVRGDVDIVIGQDWPNAPVRLARGLTRTPLLDDVIDVALPTGHRFASRGVVNLDDLARDPWVTWDRRSICHDWLVHTLHARGHEPVIDYVAAEHATQLALVAAGLCVCVMPRLGQDPLPPGVIVRTVRPILHRKIFAVWRDANTRRRAIAATLDALQRTARAAAKQVRPARSGGEPRGRAAGAGVPDQAVAARV
jgi:DNA-binding transcriptional LysR family regulator